jgi:hypothetical protein
MRVTFHNVTVTVEAQDDVEAYRLLGERLGIPPFKYASDTYSDETHKDRNTCNIGQELDEDGEDEETICVSLL